jgi:hypothetical protein
MPRKSLFPFLLSLIMVLSACTFPFSATPTITPIPTTAVPTLPLSTNTPVPPTNTPVPPTNTPVPTSSIAPVSIPYSGSYVDDRSTPWEVIISLFNAVSRKEFLRAYNYWRNPATSLGSFSSYAAGYSSTGTVDLVFGQISGDAGAGQVYYTVPVILKATNSGVHTNYAACYVIHYAQAANFGAPPFDPMGIDQGTANNISINADDATSLSTACAGMPSGANPVTITANNLNIDKSNYLDDRSGAIETVSSLLNALNLKQYVRAYYYFQDPVTYPGNYTTWSNGFSNTDAIAVTFDTVQQEGAAGSLYYKVPLAEVVTTTSASTQTFVGCYTLRLGQPANQMTPPFQPMGIISGTFTQVANGTDVGSMLPTACP